MDSLVTSFKFDSNEQRKRIKKAAKIRKWGMGKFVLDAAEKEAVKILTSNQSSEQLTVKPDLLTLNQ